MTLVGDTAVCDVPLFWAKCANEFFVVRDHHHAPLVLANRDSKAAQRVTIQEIGGFVEDEQMWIVPHGTSKHNLHFLSTTETRDLVVISDLRVKTDVLEVLRNDLGFENPVAETFPRGLVVVEFLDKL